MKAEIGKWYKNKNSNKYYGKLTGNYDAEHGTFPSETYISNGILREGGDSFFNWNDLTEVPLSEIQQYLPDGHEDKFDTEFVLPEKWCIKRTPENIKVIVDYMNEEYKTNYTYTNLDFPYIPNIKKKNSSSKYKPDGYAEITFSQFKKYVMKEEANEFKKGDYIVFTESKLWSDSFPKNYIFKQRINSKYLNPELDANGCDWNSWESYRNFNKNFKNNLEYKTNWRYGTKEEIAEYNKLGEPYCVDDLNKIPERRIFHVKYSEEFTEDLYNKLVKWCKENSLNPRNHNDTYKGLKSEKYFLFDNWSDWNNINERNRYSYGVDNNLQGCIVEYSVKQIKELINYVEPKYNDREAVQVKTHLASKIDTDTEQSNSNLPKISLNVNFSLTKKVKPKFKLPKVKTINY